MSNPLANYIQYFAIALNYQDGAKMKACLTLNPGQQEGPLRSLFAEPNDFDLYLLPEKFRPVVKSHLRLMKAVYIHKSIEKSFTELSELVNDLIRAADSQNKWINVPLMNSLNELVAVYKVKQQTHPEDIASLEFQDLEIDDTTAQKTSSLESLANTVNKAFKLSLNDKNPELHLSKRMDIYFFLALLIKVYFKLNKLELAKSVEKALKGTRFQLPDMASSVSNRTSGITYYYYSSLLSLDDGDFVLSEDKLGLALDLIRYYKSPFSKQTKQILLILLPLKMYNHQKSFRSSSKLWNRFPDLKTLYHDNLFKAVREGNLALFDACMAKFQTVFLKHHLYLLVELLRQHCYLNLIKECVSIVQQQDNPQAHIVSLTALQLSFEFSKYNVNNTCAFDFSTHSYNYTLDEIECIVANLIALGKIKGYLSHANRCIVLSKTVPFP